MSFFNRNFGRFGERVCNCDRLRVNGPVKVRGWTPNAKVANLNRLCVVTVLFETSTIRQRDVDCYLVEPICPLEELAKIASEE